ncbi:uncharacterized protein [Palaemon carinicauda]|uniref:uncharacterized protein n=1 Tax=Palaemon carinicauda TaxID=392227 RepID=UPI0035B6056D
MIQNILDSSPEEKRTGNNWADSKKLAAMRGSQPQKSGKGVCSRQMSRVFRYWHCGGEGHRRVECPTQGLPRCYTCQTYGHLSRECPAKNAPALAHLARPTSKAKETEEGETREFDAPPPPTRMTAQAVAEEAATTDLAEQALGPPSVPPTSPPQH